MRVVAGLLALVLSPATALVIAAALPASTEGSLRFALALVAPAFIALLAFRTGRDVAEREGGDGGPAMIFVILAAHGLLLGIVLTFAHVGLDDISAVFDRKPPDTKHQPPDPQSQPPDTQSPPRETPQAERPSTTNATTADVVPETTKTGSVAEDVALPRVEIWSSNGIGKFFSGEGARAADLQFVDKRTLLIIRRDGRITAVDVDLGTKLREWRPKHELVVESARRTTTGVAMVVRAASAFEDCFVLQSNEKCPHRPEDRSILFLSAKLEVSSAIRIERRTLLALAEDVPRALVNGDDGVSLMAPRDHVTLAGPKTKREQVLAGALSHDGQRAFVVRGRNVSIHDPSSATTEKYALPEGTHVLAPDGRWAFVVPKDGFSELHAVTYGSRIRKATPTDPLGTRVWFGPKGVAVVASPERLTRLMLEGGEEIEVTGGARDVVFGDDASFARVLDSAVTEVLDPRGKRAFSVPEPPPGRETFLRLSPDGQRLARALP